MTLWARVHANYVQFARMAGYKTDFLCTPGLDPLVFYWAVIIVPTTCDLCFVQMNLANSCIIVGKKISYLSL